MVSFEVATTVPEASCMVKVTLAGADDGFTTANPVDISSEGPNVRANCSCVDCGASTLNGTVLVVPTKVVTVTLRIPVAAVDAIVNVAMAEVGLSTLTLVT